MLAVGIALVVVAWLGGAAAFARADRSRPIGPTTQLLGRGRTTGPFSLQRNGITLESTEAVDVEVTRVTFAPGAATGWESFPGAVLVVVERGSLTRYSANDSSARTYTSGHAFVQNDPDGEDMVRNESTADAEAIVTLVAPSARSEP